MPSIRLPMSSRACSLNHRVYVLFPFLYLCAVLLKKKWKHFLSVWFPRICCLAAIRVIALSSLILLRNRVPPSPPPCFSYFPCLPLVRHLSNSPLLYIIIISFRPLFTPACIASQRDDECVVYISNFDKKKKKEKIQTIQFKNWNKKRTYINNNGLMAHLNDRKECEDGVRLRRR